MAVVVKDALSIVAVVAVTASFIGLHSWMYVL